ncbi:uncharacterized protein LOC123553766 [Mercenaria mercenaria]|uniref:uncharacterized protein LOC123553766 n=1 Tax=Mercenaria mercenaria TaxID=6596 RepID=UPI00234EC295|nr:uncharacterized protein LOC123553766 [Mercenaria mercenaria]XP_045199326.2 uncharacterized protein LOC123553766 [Mercenaria mercenaria]
MASICRRHRSRYPSPPPSSGSDSSLKKSKRPFLSPPPSSRTLDQDFHFYCFPCDSHGLRKEAHAYCESCTEFLCQTCYKHHRKAKALRKHKLLQKEKMYQEKLLRSKSMTDCSGKCPKHPEEIVTWYCQVHFQSGCHICKEEHHGDRFSECEAESDDGAKEDYVKELDTLDSKADQKIAKARKNREDAKEYYNAEAEKIRRLRNMLKDHLDSLENNVITDSKKILEEDNTAMETIIKECSAAKDEIQIMRNNISKGKLDKSFPLLKNYPDFVKTKAILSQNDKCNSVRRYHFEPDEGMFQYILGCTDIGIMHVAEESEMSTEYIDDDVKTESSATTIDEDEAPATTNDEDSNTEEPKAQGTISVKSKSDKKRCYITGMSVLSNDEIVIADSHNNSIKMIDINEKKITADVKLSFSPQDLTVINKNQIAVTLPCAFLSMIQLVSRFGPFRWKTSHSLKANGNCYGITSTADKLIVSFTGPPKIEILGLQGDVQKTIDTTTDGQNLFIQPWHLAISPDEKYIYVSDRGNRSLTRVPTNGDMDDVIQVSQVTGWYFSPEGVTVADDTVLVCDMESETGNVYAFTEDLTEKGVVYDNNDGLRHPKTICYSCYQNKVFITCHGDKVRSKMFVFKL